MPGALSSNQGSNHPHYRSIRRTGTTCLNPLNLPALGESVTEGTVTRWLKQVGDRVEVDEPLLEVSTDKVDTEIPSPIAGVIEEILVAEDETAEVGAPLVRIGDGSGVRSRRAAGSRRGSAGRSASGRRSAGARSRSAGSGR